MWWKCKESKVALFCAPSPASLVLLMQPNNFSQLWGRVFTDIFVHIREWYRYVELPERVVMEDTSFLWFSKKCDMKIDAMPAHKVSYPSKTIMDVARRDHSPTWYRKVTVIRYHARSGCCWIFTKWRIFDFSEFFAKKVSISMSNPQLIHLNQLSEWVHRVLNLLANWVWRAPDRLWSLCWD